MIFILFCICLMGLQAWVEWRFTAEIEKKRRGYGI
jgi:hypothetical protein